MFGTSCSAHPISRRLWLVGLVVLAVSLGAVSLAAADPAPASVRLVIDYGDGAQLHFTALTLREGMTVLDALQAAKAHRHGVSFDHRGSGSSVMVTKIGDLKNEGDGKNWLYSVNDKPGEVSAGAHKLKAGDAVVEVQSVRVEFMSGRLSRFAADIREEFSEMRDRSVPVAVFAALVALSVVMRLISPEFDAPNFGAISAATLFAGFYFRHAAVACAVPLLSMIISDYFLGGYARSVMIAVYGSLLVPIAWRSLLRDRLTPTRVGLSTVTSSVVFFLISNGMVWYVWHPHTVDGFVHCFQIALPFFANTLGGDLAFSASIFGLYALVGRASDVAAPAQLPAHAA